MCPRNIMWLGVIGFLLYSVFGCGVSQHHQATSTSIQPVEARELPFDLNQFERLESEEAESYKDLAAQYFSDTYGLDAELFDDTEVYFGDLPEIEEACGKNAWACNHSHNLFVRSDGILCQMIVHEMAHSASLYLYQHWDVDHVAMATFYREGVSELCP